MEPFSDATRSDIAVCLRDRDPESFDRHCEEYIDATDRLNGKSPEDEAMDIHADVSAFYVAVGMAVEMSLVYPWEFLRAAIAEGATIVDFVFRLAKRAEDAHKLEEHFLSLVPVGNEIAQRSSRTNSPVVQV